MADANDALITISDLKKELNSLMQVHDTTARFERLRRWKERAVDQLIIKISKREGERLQQKHLTSFSIRGPVRNFVTEVRLYLAHLESLEYELKNNPAFIMREQQPPQHDVAVPRDRLSVLNIMLSRFHTVARQMRSRHEQRPTLEINDEYDVQDLLHAILKIDFDDIRVEEWTPSYAGGSSRMDFLLKEEQAVVEVKKTRGTLKEKDIGAQLLIDIQRYQEHPNCKVLFCFIYDPEGLIGNPRGMINDLEKQSTPRLKVRVVIAPI